MFINNDSNNMDAQIKKVMMLIKEENYKNLMKLFYNINFEMPYFDIT